MLMIRSLESLNEVDQGDAGRARPDVTCIKQRNGLNFEFCGFHGRAFWLKWLRAPIVAGSFNLCKCLFQLVRPWEGLYFLLQSFQFHTFNLFLPVEREF